MKASDISHFRLYNQYISAEKFELPDQVVNWFGALQAQDYNSTKWALSVRSKISTDNIIEQSFTDMTVIRTWLTRGTLHIAAPSDVHWMLALLAPRLIRGSAGRLKQLELDEDTFSLSFKTLSRALQGGKILTRNEIITLLNKDGISTEGQRGYHILWRAGMEKLICFGPMRGNQQTFMLLDECIKDKKLFNREESIAALVERYIRSHGPATIKDFVFWSGLTTSDAKTGFEINKQFMVQEEFNEEIYWQLENFLVPDGPSPGVYLLPAFDEYFLGYVTRNIVLDPMFIKKAVSNNGIFRPIIVIDGQIVGIWKHHQQKNSVRISIELFRKLTDFEIDALGIVVNQYGSFLDKEVVLPEFLYY